jgi:hypothetical protein
MERNPAFKIVIAYENLAAGLRAKEMTERLAAQLESELEVKSDLWKFEMLDHPQLRGHAATAAAAADMVVVSTGRSDELPAHVQTWIDDWLPLKKGGVTALVALVDPATESPGKPSRLCAYLRQVAEEGGMDFFSQPAVSRRGRWDDSFATLQPWAKDSSLVLDGAFQDPPAWRGWGIND